MGILDTLNDIRSASEAVSSVGEAYRVVRSLIDERTDDLYGGFHFLLEVEAVNGYGMRQVIAGFNSVTGGGVKIEKRDTTHGDDLHKTHAPGAIEYENLSLGRVLSRNRDLLEWLNKILDGETDRRSGSIIILNNDGEELRRWNFYDAYPIAWTGPELSSDSSTIAVEKFELAVGYLRLT